MPTIDKLGERLRLRLREALPGLAAQLRMAPNPRVEWDPTASPDGVRTGAGLVLLFPGLGGPHVPLTLRAAGLRTHTGQVSLPGGSVDQGETIDDAALREAAEEIGIIPGSVEVLGRLTSVHIPVSGFELHPVVGLARERPAFRPDAREVARLIEAPIDRLADPASVGREMRTRTWQGQTMEVDVPYFAIDGEKVWGATAMILAELVAIVRGDA